MTDLDSVLRESAPDAVTGARSVELALDELVTNTLRLQPRRRRLRLVVISAAVAGALSLGAGASAAANGFWWTFLGGPGDLNLPVTVVQPGEANQDCQIGVLVVPINGATVHSASYLAAKRFLQTHDWSTLKPDPSLMMFSAAFAKAHHINLKPIIAGTVATQITDAFQRSGLPQSQVSLHGVVDCSSGSPK